ncbi:hypothetical protein [Lyngbya sp. CCY1209]|uniref:hypothetical protein n=1 Tax=Lyngbya sp. CCY1209 TaxID=2886103 RepID=UPI002D1FC3DB|nr:hypothetical protein [Lyngbya sp. CCY1209]MEB3884007.1 hypothetical protein [Lyngbya sp. CCY1209]
MSYLPPLVDRHQFYRVWAIGVEEAEGRREATVKQRKQRKQGKRVKHPHRLGINSQANSKNHIQMIGKFVQI